MNHNHAGQIVRINLENFMCYDNIEIYPRNQLNLIIGPNGSGKSSIVCAVVLGLGGKLKAIGRADQLSSYVKSGCDYCCVEIELYEPNGQNVIIRRKISSNNSSEFMINGKVSTGARVDEVKRKYNIQIDNLCTFLPQEKVQEFAQLNPQQLLDQTQRTIGHGDLVQLHEELKRLHSKSADQGKHTELLEKELENERQKNERLSDRVNCLKEKQSLCEKLATLNQKKAWLNYEEALKDKDEVDKDYQLAENDYQAKKREVDKINRDIERLENKLSSHSKKLSEGKKNEAGKKEAMDEWVRRAEGQIDELEDLRNIIQTKREEEENKKRELLKYEENVDKLTNDLETLDAEIGSEEQLCLLNEQVDKELKNIHSEEVRLDPVRMELEEEESTLQQEKLNTQRECETLKKRRNARLEYLKRREPDAYKSMEWLEQNRGLFKSHIYNPMLLELDVPNSKMAKYVEARLGYKDLISFTCTNADDLNLLIKKLRTEQKLKVNAICSDEDDETQYSPEIPINDLRCYGFHSYIKDLITGPEDIIRFLCKTYGIHCVPVGDESVKANCGRIPPSIRLFYSENDSFSVKYSAYSKDKSTIVKKLPGPRFFAESLDERRILMLLEREKDLEHKIKEKQKEIREVDNKVKGLKEALEKVKVRKRKLGTSVEERRQIKMKLSRAQKNFQSIKETLKDPEEIDREANLQREALKKKIMRSLEEVKSASEELEAARLSRQTFDIEYRVNRFGKSQLLESKQRCMEDLSRKEGLTREMKERQRAAGLLCSNLKEKAKQMTENISKEEKCFKRFKEKFATLPKTLEDIEIEIEKTQTQANFLGGENYEILQEYEEREKKIVDLATKLEDWKRDLEQRRLDLDSKQEKWLRPVEELISKINDNFGKFFESMNCAGEVSLVSGENNRDFNAYGIKIRVKFRDGVPLQELGGRFQSGGERAVSTAIFILSLQELTSVPFRFVDEINQGMDPENERRILRLLINVTASESSTQYFFITPKLLPDVEWSRTMTVHCIHKGVNAIPAAQWDMKKFLKGFSEEDNDS